MSFRSSRRLASASAGSIFTCLPQITEKSEKAFVEELLKIHENQYTPIKQIPKVFGRNINLLKMYNAVAKQGGIKKMYTDSAWEEVLKELDIPMKCGNAHVALRSIYQRYLEPFERIQRNKATISDIEEELQLEHEVSRYKSGILSQLQSHNHSHHRSSSLLSSGSSTYSTPINMVFRADMHQIDTDQRRMLGLSTDLAEHSELQKLELSLRSGLENEIELSLNTLLLMSSSIISSPTFSSSHQPSSDTHLENIGVHLQFNPRMLDCILATVGIGDIETTKLMAIQSPRMRRFLNYWDSTVEDELARKFLYSSVFEKSDLDSINSPSPEFEWSTLSFNESLSNSASDTLFGQSNDYLSDCDMLEHRIQLVATVLRNVALDTTISTNTTTTQTNNHGIIDDSNTSSSIKKKAQLSNADRLLGVLTQNRQLMRFVILCCYSIKPPIRQIGLEVMGLLRCPVIGILEDILVQLLPDLIDSDDRFDRLRGLEFTSRLADHRIASQNLSFFLSLPHSFFAKLISNMIVYDLYLVVLALEAVFSLSEINQALCFKLLQSSTELLPTLVTLLSLEAQVMGSNSLIRIRVMQGPVITSSVSPTKLYNSPTSLGNSNTSILMPPPPVPGTIAMGIQSNPTLNMCAGFNKTNVLITPNTSSVISNSPSIYLPIKQEIKSFAEISKPSNNYQNSVSNYSTSNVIRGSTLQQVTIPIATVTPTPQLAVQPPTLSISSIQSPNKQPNIAFNNRLPQTPTQQVTMLTNNLVVAPTTPSLPFVTNNTPVTMVINSKKPLEPPTTLNAQQQHTTLSSSNINNNLTTTASVPTTLIKPVIAKTEPLSLGLISKQQDLMNQQSVDILNIKSKEDYVKKWLMENFVESAQSTVPLFVIYKQLQIAVQNYFKDCEMVSAEEFHKIVRTLFPQVQLVQLQIPGGPSEIHYFNLKENPKLSSGSNLENLLENNKTLINNQSIDMSSVSSLANSTSINSFISQISSQSNSLQNNIQPLTVNATINTPHESPDIISHRAIKRPAVTVPIINGHSPESVIVGLANKKMKLSNDVSNQTNDVNKLSNGRVNTTGTSNINTNHNIIQMNQIAMVKNEKQHQIVNVHQTLQTPHQNGISNHNPSSILYHQPSLPSTTTTTYCTISEKSVEDTSTQKTTVVQPQSPAVLPVSAGTLSSCSSTVSPVHCDSLINGVGGGTVTDASSEGRSHSLSPLTSNVVLTTSSNPSALKQHLQATPSSLIGQAHKPIQIQLPQLKAVANQTKQEGTVSGGINNNLIKDTVKTPACNGDSMDNSNSAITETISNTSSTETSSSTNTITNGRVTTLGKTRSRYKNSSSRSLGSGGSYRSRGYSSQRPINQVQMYICEWDSCLQSFDKPQKVYGHVYTNHFMSLRTETESKCLWAGCRDLSLRTPLPLLNHVNEEHCNNVALENARQNRLARENSTTESSESALTTVTNSQTPSGNSLMSRPSSNYPLQSSHAVLNRKVNKHQQKQVKRSSITSGQDESNEETPVSSVSSSMENVQSAVPNLSTTALTTTAVNISPFSTASALSSLATLPKPPLIAMATPTVTNPSTQTIHRLPVQNDTISTPTVPAQPLLHVPTSNPNTIASSTSNLLPTNSYIIGNSPLIQDTNNTSGNYPSSFVDINNNNNSISYPTASQMDAPILNSIIKEGPVTKHIRFVSASILRNLCRFSSDARSFVQRRHSHIFEMAISGCESSKALLDCLYYSSLKNDSSSSM